MSTPGDHHKHASMTNRKIERDGNSAMLSFEVEGPGRSEDACQNQEFLVCSRWSDARVPRGAARRFKGHIGHYVPKGQKTGVTLVGEYVSKVIPEGQLRTVVMNQLEQSFRKTPRI